MANVISKIGGMPVNDASAIHGLTPGTVSYTVQIGTPGSAGAKTEILNMPSDVMMKNDCSNYSLKGHTHEVSIDIITDLDGDVIPTGTVSKPSIDAGNSTVSVTYMTGCDASIQLNPATTGNALTITAGSYDAQNESFSFGIVNVTGSIINKTFSTTTMLTDAAPSLSAAPTFTGNALSSHSHPYTVNGKTGADIDPTK